jgi:Bacterial Ig-like domain (group 2)
MQVLAVLLVIELFAGIVLLFQILRRVTRMSTNDPLSPISQATADLETSTNKIAAAIKAAAQEIVQAVRQLKNPTLPVGEVGGLATSIETSAQTISSAADTLTSATAGLTTAAGPVPTSIAVTPNPIALDLNGTTSQQLKVVDSDGDDISADPTTQYGSDTPASATVSASGLVTAVAVGTGNVTVTDQFGNIQSVPFSVVNSSTGAAPATAPAAEVKKAE